MRTDQVPAIRRQVTQKFTILALRRRGRPWHRDGAMLVPCMTGRAVVAFVPPAYFAGISTSRHMVGMHLATPLAFMLSVGLAASVAAQSRTAARRPTRPGR